MESQLNQTAANYICTLTMKSSSYKFDAATHGGAAKIGGVVLKTDIGRSMWF